MQCIIAQKFLFFCARRRGAAQPKKLSRKERKEMEGGNGASAVTLCSNHTYQNDAAENHTGSRTKSAEENLTQRTQSSQSYQLASALRRKPPKIFERGKPASPAGSRASSPASEPLTQLGGRGLPRAGSPVCDCQHPPPIWLFRKRQLPPKSLLIFPRFFVENPLWLKKRLKFDEYIR